MINCRAAERQKNQNGEMEEVTQVKTCLKEGKLKEP
jgi:hypothetical protein